MSKDLRYELITACPSECKDELGHVIDEIENRVSEIVDLIQSDDVGDAYIKALELRSALA
jgi:hypothetical protein